MRSFIGYALDNGLSAFFGICLLVLAARLLDIESVGMLALAIALVTVQVPIATLGMANLFYSRIASRSQVQLRVPRKSLFLSFRSGIVIYALTVVTAFLYGGAGFGAIYAAAALKIPFAYGELIRSNFRARNKPFLYLPSRIVSLSSCFVLLAIGYALQASATVLALIWSGEWVIFSLLLSAREPGLASRQLKTRPLRIVILSAIPLLVQIVGISIYYRFDQIYVGLRLGAADLAIYSVGARLAEAGNMAFGLLGLAIAPHFLAQWRRGYLSNSMKLVLVLIGVLTLAICGLLSLYGPRIIGTVFGENFTTSATIATVYFASTCFTVYGFLGTHLAVSMGILKAPMYSGILTAVFCIVLTIVLTESHGMLGAAYATVVSYALSAAIVWGFVIYGNQKTAFRMRGVK